MRIFYRRPLALLCAVFIAVSLLGFFIKAEIKYLTSALIAAAALVCVAAFAMGRLKGRRLALILGACVAAILALLCSFVYFDLGFMPAQEYRGESCEISGIVLTRRYSNNYSTGYSAKLNSINGKKVSYRVILDCEFVSDLQPGHKFEAIATPEELGYNEIDNTDRLRAISDGYVLRCVIADESDYAITGEAGFYLEVWFGRLNRRLANRISADIRGEEGRLAAALGLGRVDLLSGSTRRDFRRSGVTHLLALSGLHLTLLMGTTELILRRLRIPKFIRFPLLVGMIIFFLFLTGFAVSAIRAAIMLILLYISLVLAREADSLTSLFLAGAIILAVSPPAVADCGFWLSFAATFGIIIGLGASRSLLNIFSRRRNERKKKKKQSRLSGLGEQFYRFFVMGVVSTISSNCAVAFCLWLFFGEISAVTLLTNLLLSPLCTAALVTVFLYFGCIGLGFSTAAGFLVWLTRITATLMIRIAEYFSLRAGAVISLEYSFAGVIIISMSIAYVILCVVKLKRKWPLLMPAVVATLAYAVCFGIYSAAVEGSVKVSYLNNKGSEMIVMSSTGNAVICDLSDGSKSHIRGAIDVVRLNNLTEIDVFVLTHYHQKHIPATESLLDREVVRQIWLPEPVDERELSVMLNIIRVAEEKGCRAVIYGTGEELTVFGEKGLTVKREYIKRSTHPVITLTLSLGGDRLTYVGSSVFESGLAEDAAENIAMSRDVIFGSHGPVSKTQFSCEFDYMLLHTIIFGDDKVMSYFRYDEGDEPYLAGVRLFRSPRLSEIEYSTTRKDR